MVGGQRLSAAEVAKFKDLVRSRDLEGLSDALAALHVQEIESRAVRDWVLKDRRFFDVQGDLERETEREQEQAHWYRTGVTEWMRVMCLIALCPPTEAAKAIRWAKIVDDRPEVIEPVSRFLEAQPKAWVKTFTDVTSHVRVPDRGGIKELVWLVNRGLDAHGLPCPEGATFVENHLRPRWTDDCWSLQLGDLKKDRLVPDILYRKAELGFGSQLASLETTLRELLDDGIIGRAEFVESCLKSWTSASRPGSQRTLVKLLSRIEVQAREITGGVPYMTGVIATRDGMVGAFLLPLALEVLDDPVYLDELARVVASRKERKQRSVLLKAICGSDFVGRVGLEAVLAAIETLAAGQEDASFLRAIEKSRLGLGVKQTDGQSSDVRTIGLWDMTPDPGPEREWAWWIPRAFGWRANLDRNVVEDSRGSEYITDQFIRDVAVTGADELVRRCVKLRLDDCLAINRLIRLVEPAFLAGELSILWPAMLTIANDAASAGKTLAGMPELLRLLARYAAEVPDAGTLPPRIADLAARPGDTKAQLEARSLGAALAKIPLCEFSAEPGMVPARPSVGLWSLTPHPDLRPFSGILVENRIDMEHWANVLDGFVGNNGSPHWARQEVIALSPHHQALDPCFSLESVVKLMDQGRFSLSGFAASLGFVFQRGALRAMWPFSLAVAAAAAQRTPKPNGLAQLLNVLASYAPDVPQAHRAIPQEFLALSSDKGTSRSHLAARSLVATLRGPGPSV